jgi:hypothetical protein
MNNKDIFDIVLAMKVRGGGSVTVLEDKTVTPDFSNGDVTISPDEGYDALSSVTIEKDPDLVAGNIKKDVNVFGITGTLDAGSSDYYKSMVDGILDKSLVHLETDIQHMAITMKQYNNLVDIKAPNLLITSQERELAYFENCINLTTVELDSAELLGRSIFAGCSKLSNIYIPNVITICGSTFDGNASLELLDLPKVTSIGYAQVEANYGRVFRACTKLKTIILRANEVCTLFGSSNFANMPFASNGSGGTLYVPQDLISAYQSANNWNTILGYPNNQIKAIEGSIYE